MKKKSFLKVLFAVLSMLALAMGQTAKAEVVEIGSDASTLTFSTIPFNTSFNYSLTQQIYTAAEIGTAGYINAISFKYAYTEAFTMSGVKIYMKHVQKSAFEESKDMVAISASDLVFAGDFTAAGQGWTTITLDTPFSYNGTDNLLICCFDPTNGETGSSFNFYTTYSGGSYMAYGYYSSIYIPNLDDLTTWSGGSQRYTSRNTIRLNITDSGVTIPTKPTSLTASDITTGTATLTWSGGSGIYNVEKKMEGEDEWTRIATNTTQTSILIGVDENAEYQARVQSVSPDDATVVSAWVTTTFHSAIQFPVPTGLTATLTPGDGTVATLSWTENGSATGWELEYGTDPNFNTIIRSLNLGYFPKVLTGLTPEQTYYFRVRSVCDDGVSRWSSACKFTPTSEYKITANDGTATNGFVPIYGYWADQLTRSQFIIEAAELSSIMYCTIDTITFYLSQSSVDLGDATFDAYLGEVSQTTFADATLVDWTNLDKVYSGSVTISDNKMKIVLDTPYQYLGGNLLVGFNQTTKGSYKTTTWYGVEATGAAVGGYNTSLSVQNFRPKFTFNYTPGTAPTCFKPTNVTISNITTESAVVSWTSDASAWNLRYKLKDAENWTTVAVTGSTSYVLTGLSPAANYEVQVQADCGSGSPSNWTGSVDISTPICTAENQGTISYKLIDSYGDGWNGAKIQVVHANSGYVAAELTIASGDSAEGTLNLCCGEEYNFIWVSGSYDKECSFFLYDELGDEIVSYVTDGSNGPTAGTLITYTMECVSCKKPTDLMLTAEPTANSASLVWTRGREDQTMWDLAYMAEGDADFTLIEELTDTTYTLTGLQDDTPYLVKVRANCGGGDVSVWTAELAIRTAETYPKPTDVTVTDLAHTSAVARWTGNTAGKYDLRYRKVSGVASNFENSSMKPWTSLDADGDGYGWEVWTQASSYLDLTNTSVNPGQAYNGTDEMIVSGSYSNVYGVLTPDNYLISPKVQLGGSISFYAKGQDQTYCTEHFGVAVSTAGNTDDADFTTIEEWDTTNEWQFFTVDLSAYAGQEGYVAIRHFDCSDMFVLDIDDIVLTEPGEGYAWTTVSDITEDSCYLAGLSMDTAYEVQVRSNYGSGHYSNWTPSTNFSTLDENTKFFLMDGNWDVASKWTPAGVPVAGNTVHIRAAATVPSGYDMPQMNVIVENGGSILVKDGAQFRSDSSVEITMEKHITGYGDGLANFYLLGSPVYYDNPSADDVENLLDGEYDLYSFDATEDLEWRNYEADAFDMPNAGVGYLYASKDDNTLISTGQTFATNSYRSMSFAYDDSSTDPFNGWALVSNIFPCNGWLLCTDESSNVVDGNFYKMNAAGGMLEMYQGAIALTPGEAAFVQLNQAGKIYFFPYEQAYRTPVYVGTVDGTPWVPNHELTDHQDADAPTGFTPGDVDMDGDVDFYDVPAMADALVGKWPNFTLETFDYDGDGVFSLKDLTKLVNYLKGK